MRFAPDSLKLFGSLKEKLDQVTREYEEGTRVGETVSQPL
jgi:hypothetical protein